MGIEWRLGMQNNIDNALEFYNLVNSLCDLIRTGHKQWNIKRERLESIAEHVFSTAMIVISVESVARYEIDVKKTIFMIVLHDLAEAIMGDYTLVDKITKQERDIKELESEQKLFNKLLDKEEYIMLLPQ